MITLKRNVLFLLAASSSLALTGGCSSVMTHTGGEQGYYSGTRANLEVLSDSETSWAMTPVVLLDMPFSAVLDTILVPYDYSRSGSDKRASSPRERLRGNKQPLATLPSETTAPIATAAPTIAPTPAPIQHSAAQL